MRKKYFDILNLTPPSNEEEIKQAYRNLAKKYHPDINPEPDAHQKFLEISEAYEFLLDDLRSKGGRVVYDQDDVISREYIEELRRKARERAEERARKKKEKTQKQHEDFQESGLYDAVLFLSYLVRYAGLFLCLTLISLAIVSAFTYTETTYVVKGLMFVAGVFGLFLILKNRKEYFKAGKFYYNYQRIKRILTLRNPEAQESCFFAPGYVANSIPYKVNMMKIKDVKLRNYGPGQHGVAFNQKSVTLKIPRSHHALVVHSILIVLKMTILAGCIFFLEISSVLWRIIIAVFLTLLLSKLILIISGTRSTVSYLATTGIIVRMTIWLLVITIFSYIQLYPFNIYTSDYMYFITVFMLFFDSFLDQFLNFISNKRFQKPLFRQHPLIEQHLEKKYQFGYDMPVLSVFYPVYKWFLG